MPKTQIEKLQDEKIFDLKLEILRLEEEIYNFTKLKNELMFAESDIDDLKMEVDDLENENALLIDKVENFEKKL